MKNKAPYIALGISFILFNLIAFLIPTTKSSSFWIAYAFSVVAFIVLLFIWNRAIDKKQDLKSKFLGFPITYVSVGYLIIQLIAFLTLMFIPGIPIWCSILICAVILCVSAVCMIAAGAGTSVITQTEKKIAVKRQFIKALQIDVEMLADKESDSVLKQRLTELAKKIRYSDPMSDPLLEALEEDLAIKISSIESSNDKAAAISEAETLLLRRNKKVKALKG